MTPDQLREEFLAWTEDRSAEWSDGTKTLVDPTAALVFAILLQDGFDKNHKDGWHYTCREFDESTNQCTIYERRPKMCQDFGTIVPCTLRDCTWQQALREKKPGPKEVLQEAVAEEAAVIR